MLFLLLNFIKAVLPAFSQQTPETYEVFNVQFKKKLALQIAKMQTEMPKWAKKLFDAFQMSSTL